MAGASLAAELAGSCSVIVLEGEAQPGYHATGRSAAFWSETYGGKLIQPLTTASRAWLANPPTEYNETGFLSPRGEINIGIRADREVLETFRDAFTHSTVSTEWCNRDAIARRCDFLKPEWDCGIAVPSCADIDVARLHQAYLRRAKQLGATLRCNAALQTAARSGSSWRIATSFGEIEADVLVNAAGAWVDVVARLAGAKPLGIRAYRRTMLQVRLDREVPDDLPLIIDIKGGFYFKPDRGGLWLSPHDETPSPACDVAPDELDVAIAVDRFERAATARVISVTRRWAGLRSFAPDRLPVYGDDPQTPGLFWFAGQGGFGIQTAPAAAKLAAALLLGQSPEVSLSGIDPARYAPDRLI